MKWLRDGRWDVARQRAGWDVNEFETQVLGELSVLKTQMEQLLGIGQPGRLCALEARVEAHEQNVQRVRGMLAAFGGVLTLVHLGLAWIWGR